MIDPEMIERGHQLTVRRLEELQHGAEAKMRLAEREGRAEDAAHWGGYAMGVRRALDVVKGRGQMDPNHEWDYMVERNRMLAGEPEELELEDELEEEED